MVLWLVVTLLSAREVNIAKDLPYVDIEIDGATVRVERIQDQTHKLTNSYIRTSRPTPPFYIQPYQPIPGIETVSELDVIYFIRDKVKENRGLLIDARMPKWYQHMTIPGALNVPFSILSKEEGGEYIAQVFDFFGVVKKDKSWDFSKAETLLIFDNGPWCQQGVYAMKHLVNLGYPKDKILYYRGGMQFWQILGLTTIKPKE